ncbi:MAG: hypothetical protein IJV18_12805, partial [Acidaminococcaceae bacterium]|nr:hypothetical protein [Acidaminococcaceae bacterium]
ILFPVFFSFNANFHPYGSIYIFCILSGSVKSRGRCRKIHPVDVWMFKRKHKGAILPVVPW